MMLFPPDFMDFMDFPLFVQPDHRLAPGWLRGRRSNPHRPEFHKRCRSERPEVREERGVPRPTHRRAHGLFRAIAPTPSAVASARARADLYRHAGARGRDQLTKALARVIGGEA